MLRCTRPGPTRMAQVSSKPLVDRDVSTDGDVILEIVRRPLVELTGYRLLIRTCQHSTF